MAVSFTAEYLYQGAQFLRSDPNGICPEALLVAGRGIYSFGLLVVSPIGILWHTCAAAYRALAQCWTANGAEASALAMRMWQHLYAAVFDLFGGLFILFNSLMLACVPAAFVFHDLLPLAIPACLFCEAFLNNRHELILPYFFARYPVTAFGRFLSNERTEGAAFSPREEYFAYYEYDPMVREGLAIDRLLTHAEIAGFNVLLNRLLSNAALGQADPLDYSRLGPTFLRNYNRIAPGAEARIESLLTLRA